MAICTWVSQPLTCWDPPGHGQATSSSSSSENDSEKEWDEYEEVVLGDDGDAAPAAAAAEPAASTAAAAPISQRELALLRELMVLFAPAGSDGACRPTDEPPQEHAEHSPSAALGRFAMQRRLPTRRQNARLDGLDWDADTEEASEPFELCHRLVRMEAKLDRLSSAVARLESAHVRAKDSELRGD
jgi:hypothetical protein